MFELFACHSYQTRDKTFPKCYMASEISKKYTYKCVDHSRHVEIKGAKAKYNYVHMNKIVHTIIKSLCTYLVMAPLISVSSLVDEGTVRSIKLQHS